MLTILWLLRNGKTLIGLLGNVLSSLRAFGIGVWWFRPLTGGKLEKWTKSKEVRIAELSIMEGGVVVRGHLGLCLVSSEGLFY